MSSACTCHINVEECVYCNGKQIIFTDSSGDVMDVYKNGECLNFYSQSKCDNESAEVALEKKQIKELMLFLDKNYGYLLEGVK